MLLHFDSSTANDAAPQSRAHFVLSLMIPLHTLAVLLVAARVLVKVKLRKLGVADVFIVIATCIAFALLIVTVMACKYGYGVHTRDMHPDWIVPYSKILYVGVALGTACYYTTKVSILFFYLTLATEPYLRTTCHAIIAIATVSSTAILGLNLFGCTPVSGAWDRRPGDHSVCVTGRGFYYYTAISNVLIDVVLLVLPVPIMVRMRVAWRVKVGVVLVFSMGFWSVGSIVSAVSAVSVWSVVVSIYSTDIMWDGALSWLLAMLELNVGIMTACMPSMKLFFKWLRGAKERVPGEETIGGGGGGGGRRRGRGLVESGSVGSGEGEEKEWEEVGEGVGSV